jgi:hypothetical protein
MCLEKCIECGIWSSGVVIQHHGCKLPKIMEYSIEEKENSKHKIINTSKSFNDNNNHFTVQNEGCCSVVN